MKEHISLKLALILCLITATIMGVFAGIRHYHSNQLFEQEVNENAQIISERIANHVKPSIWEIYLSSENRRFSEEAASAVLDSEMKNSYIDAIIVYGRFGHVYMGRVSDQRLQVVPYQTNKHASLIINHPNKVDHPIRNGTMTIGKVTVFFNDLPLRAELTQTLKLDLIQTLLISVFIILVLFITIKKVLIKPIESLEIARNTFNSLDEGIAYLDNDNHIFDINPAFTAMTGFTHNDMTNEHCGLFSLDQSANRFLETIENAIHAGKSWSGEALCTGKDGITFPVHLTASQVINNEQQKICRVLVFQDISQQKEAEERLSNLAFFDSLTGLANRRKFEDLVALEIESSKRMKNMLGLLFIDLDDFKYINDTLGHSMGDELLIEMGKRFKNRIRESDHIARLGGDEFTIIAPHVEHEDSLATLAEALIHIANESVTLQGQSYKISATIGISIYPKDGEHLDELMKHADSAMYQAKACGKGTYAFYSSEVDKKIQHKQKIKSLLRNCIEKKELYLQYQPKICLDGLQCMTGAEALIRWQTEEYGLIPPDEFIPIAEESNTIIKIGEWVIQEAFAKASYWNRTRLGKPIKLAINLSAHQLHDAGFISIVRRELQSHDVNPEWIEFEITESAIITSFDASIVILSKLKELGFSLSLDDFGTGYSSLNYLTKLPIDILKIDKSFVFDVGISRRAESVVETIVALSKSLGLSTVAEGIETKEHLEFLLSLGCEHGQGYYFSRPLSAPDFESYLADGADFSTLSKSSSPTKTIQ